MKLERSFLLGSLGLFLAAACGGVINPAGDEDAGTPSGGSSSTGGGGSSGGGDAGSSGSSGGRGGGSTGGTAGVGVIPCGMAGTCMAPNVCCAGAGPGGNSDTCATQSACNTAGGNIYMCTTQANCPGQICCVMTGAHDMAQCQATCPTGAGGGGRGGGGARSYQVCQTSAECMNGQRCGMHAPAITVCQ